MKRFLIVLTLLVFFVLLPVSASNMSFSSLGQLAPQQVLVYAYNSTTGSQTLFASGNTTGTGIAIPTNGDFTVVIKPDNMGAASTSTGILQSILDFATANTTAIAFVCFLIGLLYLGRRP